jgi:hypothetical protein
MTPEHLQIEPRSPTAPRIERVHRLLQTMPAPDWLALRTRLAVTLPDGSRDRDLELADRLFRVHEPCAGAAGGAALRVVQTIVNDPVATSQLNGAQEQMRARVRFVLREMSDSNWAAFKPALEQAWADPDARDATGVLELAFRLGESVSNIEMAACALAERNSGHAPILPEVARKNALARASVRGASGIDVEAIYQAAREQYEKVEATAQRAAHTLASRYVAATSPYRHARNTVFRLVDTVIESPSLMAGVAELERELLAVPALSREELRWALHRMPVADRVAVLRLIPLNTILMFQPDEAQTKPEPIEFRAARDRRLAYEYFVQDRSERDLAVAYGLTLHGVKSTLGGLLHELLERPLARLRAHAYLERTKPIAGMTIDEARRRMKQLDPGRRSEILALIPACAWRAPEGVIHLHRQLFLDYISGDWVLAALVHHYNLDPGKRLGGTFQRNDDLTLRGANAAIAGVLTKIAEEPAARQRLRDWTAPSQTADTRTTEVEFPAETEDTPIEAVLPQAAPWNHTRPSTLFGPRQ